MLTLLRHAKSGWDDPAMRDVDRPLTARGREAARMVGREWRRRGLLFDHVLASPARRVVETLAEVEAGYGGALGAVFDRRVYLAAPDLLIGLVRAFPVAARRALLVGHNPGLQQLVLIAAAGDAIAEVATKYPTATSAELRLPGDWRGFGTQPAMLTRFTRPRDLDPA